MWPSYSSGKVFLTNLLHLFETVKYKIKFYSHEKTENSEYRNLEVNRSITNGNIIGYEDLMSNTFTGKRLRVNNSTPA